MPIAPIQTTYKGYRFRSRLEARWAVFFDALGVPWEYEPEGFVLPSGAHYLPDFRVMLDGHPYWFEIKPGDEAENAKFTEFMHASPQGYVGAVLNDIPDPVLVQDSFGNEYYPDRSRNPDRPFVLWSGEVDAGDNYYRFCVCAGCGVVGFQFEGRSARLRCKCPCLDGHGDKDRTADHPRIIAAFAKARSARFEHDERERW